MTERALTPVPWLLRLGLHLLVVVLLVLTVVRALLEPDGQPAALVVAALTVGVVYAAGTRLAAVRRSLAGAGVWLGVLLVCWLGLLVLTPDAIWLAFAWYFLLLHLLRWRLGLGLVAVTALVAIGGFAWHQATFTVAMALGPLLGAVVVVATVWGFEQLYAESERRRALIAELQATRAELAAAERRQGVLAERERLAREIHDTLTQGFSSVNLLLTAVEHHLQDPQKLPEASRYIQQARQVATDNLGESRRMVSALAPQELAGASLVGALERLAERHQDGHPRISVHIEGEPFPLPTALEVALLRIAQSALANALRHARAQRVGITLTFLHDQVSLDVVDDGVGFDLESVRPEPGPEGGFGLASMRSRAIESGGTLTVETAPGRGCAVSARFPIGAASAEDA